MGPKIVNERAFEHFGWALGGIAWLVDDLGSNQLIPGPRRHFDALARGKARFDPEGSLNRLAGRCLIRRTHNH
jgi:hypothetical protein